MKLNNTQEQLEALAKMVSLHASLFTCKSCDAKMNAQRNLDGRTHYVDDSSLKFHHSRILGAKSFCCGLLFALHCTDGLDWENRKRGHRVSVFDVFGTVVTRPDLEKSSSTAKGAWKVFEEKELDAVTYYREVIEERIRHAREELDKLETTLRSIQCLGNKP